MKLAEKYVFSSSTVANIDRDAINQNESGYGFHLMEKAAKFSFQILKNECPESISVFCGTGNNAGDGYLLAKYAIESGVNTRVISIESKDKLSGDAKRAMDEFEQTGGEVERWSPEIELNADWIVDAIFGIGLNRKLEMLHQDVIHAINQSE